MQCACSAPTPPPLVLPQGGMGDRQFSTQNFLLQLIVLLWQNHHPRVLPKAFQWKVACICLFCACSSPMRIFDSSRRRVSFLMS